MNERWRKPVIPIDVEDSDKSIVIGLRRYCRSTFILDEEGIDRVRLGYVCISCLEPHEHNHPRNCNHCYFPIRAMQDDVFEEMYAGEAHVGPSTTDADELLIAQEIVDRGNRS